MTYTPTAEESIAFKHLFYIASNNGETPTIGGAPAVKFFITSGVSVPILKQIWSIASNGQKEMSIVEFSAAMRLIALAQNGQTIDENSLERTRDQNFPLPKFQNVEIPLPSSSSGPSSSSINWSISTEQRGQYEKLWQSFDKNSSGLLEGKDAALFFAKSGQNRDILRAIWQMSDVSNDGMMDFIEFMIGMHLTMMVKKGHSLPNSLPPELLQSAKEPTPPASSSEQKSSSFSKPSKPLTDKEVIEEARTILQSQILKTQDLVWSLKAERAKLQKDLEECNQMYLKDLEKSKQIESFLMTIKGQKGNTTDYGQKRPSPAGGDDLFASRNPATTLPPTATLFSDPFAGQ